MHRGREKDYKWHLRDGTHIERVHERLGMALHLRGLMLIAVIEGNVTGGTFEVWLSIGIADDLLTRILNKNWPDVLKEEEGGGLRSAVWQ